MAASSKRSTTDIQEVDKFSSLAQYWWDQYGQFRMLHVINPIRISYIKTQICNYFSRSTDSLKPFKNLTLLDIGCGGGLISIPMYNLGAEVLGIDASKASIDAASQYANNTGLEVKFKCITVEELAKQAGKFDIILALEVIEHVSDYEFFLEAIVNLLNQKGILIISSINRTLKSLLLAKLGAEYILKWVPVGTHDWNKFIKPEEIADIISSMQLNVLDIQGMNFNLLSKKWCLSGDDHSVNYLLTAAKG